MKEGNAAEGLHEKTRKIYEKQHQRIAGDDTVFNRISASYSAEKFNIDAKWFVVAPKSLNPRRSIGSLQHDLGLCRQQSALRSIGEPTKSCSEQSSNAIGTGGSSSRSKEIQTPYRRRR